MAEVKEITIKDYSEDVLNELEDVDEAGGDMQGSIVAKGTCTRTDCRACTLFILAKICYYP